MNFVEYYESGEEDVIGEKERQIIDEGLIDVLFSTLRTNMKVNVSGPLIYFRWEWMNSKTFFSLRIKKKTFKSLLEWLKRIENDAFDGSGEKL